MPSPKQVAQSMIDSVNVLETHVSGVQVEPGIVHPDVLVLHVSAKSKYWKAHTFFHHHVGYPPRFGVRLKATNNTTPEPNWEASVLSTEVTWVKPDEHWEIMCEPSAKYSLRVIMFRDTVGTF